MSMVPDQPNERARRLYVVAFTSGTMKVGRAANVASRLQDHIRDAAVHGHDLVASWTSEPHSNFRETEQALIDFCSAHWSAVAREYFRDADFDEAVAFAKALPYRASQAAEDGAAAEARAQRTAMLDRFESAVARHADSPLAEWPEPLRRLAEMGFVRDVQQRPKLRGLDGGAA